MEKEKKMIEKIKEWAEFLKFDDSAVELSEFAEGCNDVINKLLNYIDFLDKLYDKEEKL